MKRRVVIFWALFIAVAATRVFLSFGAAAPSVGNCLKQNVHGVGTITTEPERKETGQILVVSVNELSVASTSKQCPVDFQIRMKTKQYPRFIYGENVAFAGNLSKPFNFKEPSGRSFDYKEYLAKDDIFYEIKSAIVKLDERVDTKSAAKVSRIPAGLYLLKRAFVHNLERALGEPHAALAAGLVVGEKAALGTDLLNDFRTVGLIHIVVLSGYNITVVADAMRRLLSFLPRVWGIVVGGIGIFLFGILVGGGATVVRSCFMAGVALSADLIRRDYNVIRALFLAALVMLIQNPLILLHDPSFQLSFLATLGLVILASPIEKRLTFLPEKFGLRGIMAATIATQIFVSPYILYMMGQLSLVGVIVNILVLPFIPATMFFVFLTGMSGLFWQPLSQAFGWIAHLLLTYELTLVTRFAKLPFAAVHVRSFPFFVVGAFYAILFAGWIFMKWRSKKLSQPPPSSSS